MFLLSSCVTVLLAGEVEPTEAAPIEAAPVEAAPVEAAPVEAAPVEAAPAGAASLSDVDAPEPAADASVEETAAVPAPAPASAETEGAAPEVSAAETSATVPTDGAADEPPQVAAPLGTGLPPVEPEDVMNLPPPNYRGLGMLYTGATISVAAFSLTLAGSVTDMQVAREVRDDPMRLDSCIEGCSAGPIFNLVSLPFHLSASMLLGFGMRRYGRSVAYRDVASGSLEPKRRTTAYAFAGLGAIVVGVGTFITTQALDNGYSAFPAARLRATGWWVGSLGVHIGAGLAGYAGGYRGGLEDYHRTSRVTVTPMVSRHASGLGLSGRF